MGRFVLAMAAILTASQVAAADWKLIAEGQDGVKLFMDKDSYRFDKQSNTTTVWEKREGIKQKIKGKSVAYAKSKNLFYCLDNKFQSNPIVYYGKNNQVIEVVNQPEFYEVVPDSITEIMMIAACGNMGEGLIYPDMHEK